MTHTEVKEFLERMPWMTEGAALYKKWATGMGMSRANENQLRSWVEDSRTNLAQALDVIDLLVAEKQQIRREALLEAAKLACPPCRVGAKVTNADGKTYHFDSMRTPMGLCVAEPIHRKLAEEVGR